MFLRMIIDCYYKICICTCITDSIPFEDGRHLAVYKYKIWITYIDVQVCVKVCLYQYKLIRLYTFINLSDTNRTTCQRTNWSSCYCMECNFYNVIVPTLPYPAVLNAQTTNRPYQYVRPQ